MDRKDYISDNLRKISSELKEVAKNGAVLPVFDKKAEGAEMRDSEGGVLTKAQENRLSDVYKAKLDISARISKGLALLDNAEKSAEIQIENCRKLIGEWTEKLEILKNLEEPTSQKDLNRYIRTVEHYRMDFFSAEPAIEAALGRSQEFNSEKSVVDVKEFYAQLRMLTKLLIILCVIMAVGSLVIAGAIWFSMQL